MLFKVNQINIKTSKLLMQQGGRRRDARAPWF